MVFRLLVSAALYAIALFVQAQDPRMLQVVPPEVHLVREASLPSMTVNGSASVSPVSGYTVTVSQTRIMAGGFSPHHNHPDEELIVLISGRLRVITPDGERIMESGDVLVVEAYAEHQFQAIEDVYMVEAFGPGRGVRASAPSLAE